VILRYFFGNLFFDKWLHFKVCAISSRAAIHSLPVGKYFMYNVCVCCCRRSVMLRRRVTNLATALGDPNHATPLKSYAASWHMEALSSVYMLSGFCRIRVLLIWNLSFKDMIGKCETLQKCKRFCGIILYRLLMMKRCEIKMRGQFWYICGEVV